jgi:hypothetical protein
MCYGENPMPWTVLTELERARHRARESSGRIPGACHDTIASLIAQTSALLRRRNTEDMATIAALITGQGYCVPCIAMLTSLDARRIYAALERLREDTNLRLVSDRCTRCGRTTTINIIQPQ